MKHSLKTSLNNAGYEYRTVRNFGLLSMIDGMNVPTNQEGRHNKFKMRAGPGGRGQCYKMDDVFF